MICIVYYYYKMLVFTILLQSKSALKACCHFRLVYCYHQNVTFILRVF